ncbi:hypothetical protein [Natrinema limicola]|nr:hypothetical protein [Natrinema limicola]
MQEAANITTIDGSGGDDGIDCFRGEIDGEITIFQHKYHTGRLEYTQKRQISDSLDRAQEEHSGLEKWILLIATEFTPTEHEWFQEEIVSPNSGIDIEYWNKPKIENRLIQYDFLIERYFNESLFATGKKIDDAFDFMSGDPVDKVVGAGDMLRDLKEKYSHLGVEFNYNSEEGKYEAFFNPEFDIEISAEMDINEEKAEKLQDGEEVELSKDEVEELDISPGIFDVESDEIDSILIQPSYKSIEKDLRIEIPSSGFQKGLTFTVEDLSDDGIKIRSKNDLFDLYIMTHDESSEGEIGYETDLINEPIHRIAEFIEFLNQLEESDNFLIRDSETDEIIFRAGGEMIAIPEELELVEIFTNNLYDIEAYTGKSFIMTEDWDEEDISNARIVRDLLVDGEADVSWSSFEFTVPSSNAHQLLDIYDKEGTLTDAQIKMEEYRLPILEEEVEFEMVTVELPSSDLKNRDTIEDQLEKGEPVKLEFTPEDSAVMKNGSQ